MKRQFFLKISVLILISGIINIHSAYSLTLGNKILQPDKKLGRTGNILANTVVVRLKEGYTIESLKGNNSLNVNISEPLLDKSQSLTYNSKLKNNILNATTDKIIKIIKTENPLLRTYIINFDADEQPEDFCRHLKTDNPAVEIAEPYYVYDKLGGLPDDPFFTSQGYLITIRAPDAWAICPGDTNVIIAVSDNGVFQQHEDLVNSIAPNWGEIPGDGIDNDSNGYIDDYFGMNLAHNDDNRPWDDTYNDGALHGTAIAGIIGATTNNKLGIAGVADKCRIFPIKTAEFSVDAIKYGYQSIIYAAIRGCKVINCSWGSVKPFSDIDQSVIDYAVSRDLAVVAAGGNQDTDVPLESSYFPAGYLGVLGVGEVDESDQVTATVSVLGSPVRIMATGVGNWGTTNEVSGYQRLGYGTSFAAPIISGALGIVRSKFPNLSPIQAEEHLRLTADDISKINNSNTGLIPGRVNMLKAVQTDPFSIPGLVVLKSDFYTSGVISNRFNPGDFVNPKISLRNYLGEGNNVKFTLSVALDWINSVQLIDSTTSISHISKDQEFTLSDFTFRVLKSNTGIIIFRVDITGDNGYKDFFKVSFTPTSQITTFSNDAIKFSVTDKGLIGFDNNQTNRQGAGFNLKNFGNELYKGGIIAENNGTDAVSSIFSDAPDDNDFDIIKPFTPPDIFTGTIVDSKAFTPIGLQISQYYFLKNGYFPFTKIFVTVKNVSGKILNDVGMGYYLDWDIGIDEDKNNAGLFPEAIPASISGNSSAALFARSVYDGNPFIGVGAYSADPSTEAQAAALYYDLTKSFGNPDIIKALTSGQSWVFNTTDDISTIIGMLFKGSFQVNAEKNFCVCIGAAENKDKLSEYMQQCLDPNFSSVPDNSLSTGDFNIFPQPANDYINISLGKFTTGFNIDIYDIFGYKIFEDRYEYTNGIISINTRNLASGSYFIRIQNGNKTIVKPLMIMR